MMAERGGSFSAPRAAEKCSMSAKRFWFERDRRRNGRCGLSPNGIGPVGLGLTAGVGVGDAERGRRR